MVAVTERGSMSFTLLRDPSNGDTVTAAGHGQLARPLMNLLVALGAAPGPDDLDPVSVSQEGSYAWPFTAPD